MPFNSSIDDPATKKPWAGSRSLTVPRERLEEREGPSYSVRVPGLRRLIVQRVSFASAFAMINDDLFFEVKKRYDEGGSNEL